MIFDIKTATSLFVFYLIISGNYLAELFGCRIQRVFSNNMWIKHLFGFLTLLFFVILASEQKNRFKTNIFVSTILYIWFLLTTRCNIYFWTPIILLLATAYLLDVYKKSEDIELEDNKNFIEKFLTHEKIDQIQSILLYIAVSLTIVGVVIYFIQKKMEYKNSFDPILFFIGRPDCRNNTYVQPSILSAIKKTVKLESRNKNI